MPIYIAYCVYTVYALVKGEISIRDPYICANKLHAVFVVCAVKLYVAIGFKLAQKLTSLGKKR